MHKARHVTGSGERSLCNLCFPRSNNDNTDNKLQRRMENGWWTMPCVLVRMPALALALGAGPAAAGNSSRSGAAVTTIKVCKRRPAEHRCDVKAMSRSPPPRRRSPSPKDGGRARSRSPPAGDRDRDDGCKSLLVRNIPTDVRPQELKVEVFLCPAFCSWQFSWSFFSLGVTRICSPSLASSATSIAPTTTTRSSPSVSHSLNSSTAPTRPRRERNSTAPRSSASPCQSRKRSMGARTGTTCVHGMLADMYSLLLRLHDESLPRCSLPCQH